MKGKVGVQQGEKRGKYNTNEASKQVRLKIYLIEEVEKKEKKSFSDKISNLLKINNKNFLHF